MAKESLRLDGVIEAMREPIREYCGLLKELAADNAKTLTLFGAIAAGAFDATRHTVRNVLLLESVDLGLLRSLAQHGAKLGKNRISAPVIMTNAYIKSSLDTFALELIEIRQMHVTVFGDDPFEELAFEDAHVRLQCEREFKAILIGLRQGLLAAAGRDKILEALEVDVGEGLVRTLRGLLWLKGQKDGKAAGDVIAEVEKMTERKLPGVRAALDATGAHGWDQFQSLYGDVESLAEIANA